MGKVKSEYEKKLKEFYDIEEVSKKKEVDLKSLMGTEYRHIINHFAAKKDMNEIVEELPKEYE